MSDEKDSYNQESYLGGSLLLFPKHCGICDWEEGVLWNHDKVNKNERVVLEGDFNSHVGSDVGNFGEVNEDLGIRQVNHWGVRLINWSVGKGLHLM